MGNDVELRFLVDEDVPRSTTCVLRDAGYDAVDVHDVGIRGKEIGEQLLKQLAIIEIGQVRLRGG
jgi:hypothetical protein